VPLSSSSIVRLSPTATLRHPVAGEVEIARGEVAFRAPSSIRDLFLSFDEPRAIGDVYAELETDLDVDEFVAFIATWVERDILVEDVPAATGLALEHVLTDQALQQLAPGTPLGRALSTGSLCVVCDAFRPDFADELTACLESCDTWKSDEKYEPFHAYNHHNLYEAAALPAPLKRCARIFDDARTKALVTRAAGIDCTAEASISASRYLPGDYCVPHSDAGHQRTVAFIWHLSRGWDPRWGGHLVWCTPITSLAPTYNTLYLFRVGPESYHFVTPVARNAVGKRLTINGWWRTDGESAAAQNNSDEVTRRWASREPRELVVGIYAVG
jgi:hypothetical protein